MWSMWSNAIRAGIRSSLITRAATGIVRNARRSARAKWLAERQAELLPVPYFHVVFTLPREDRQAGSTECATRFTASCSARRRKRCSLSQPIPDAWAQPSAFWRFCTPGDRTFICIRIFIAWCRAEALARMDIAGSAAERKSFFLPVKVLSCRFRNLFLTYLRKAFEDGRLTFHGEMAELSRSVCVRGTMPHSETEEMGGLCQSRLSVGRNRS